MTNVEPSGPMAFRRFGRSYHVRIESPEELLRATSLDEAHWVAMGAPIQTINCDLTFLRLVDSDHNDRIMTFEVKEAIRWAFAKLADTSGLREGNTTLRLEAVRADDEEGASVRTSAGKMLHSLGTPDAEAITLDQVRRIKSQVEATAVSEAGVVLPEAADDPEIRQFIADAVATVGGAPHPSGKTGLDRDHLDSFLAQGRAHLDWLAAGAPKDDGSPSPVMPLGDRTADAHAVFAAMRPKVDEYFAQCEAAAYDPRMVEGIALDEAKLAALDRTDPKAIAEFIRGAPLATPRADRTLPFDQPVNPAYARQLRRLRAEVVEPALGAPAPSLSAEQWQALGRRFAPYEAWLASEAGPAVAPLGPEKLSACQDGRFRSAVESLIAESTETAFVLDNIRLTEKLILYQAYLMTLANNFVSFPHLYDPGSRAAFEMGTLVMDGRHYNLSVRVADRAQHGKVAATGNMFVLYAEVNPSRGGQKYEIALPVTSGGRGNLCVGKRGMFRDHAGRESDVQIVQIIENPISLGEALAAPFKRIVRLLSGKIESITASAEKELDTTTVAAVDQVKQPPPAPGARPSTGLAASGMLMGGGVAIAAVGSAWAYATKTLAGIHLYKILIAVGVAVLAVMLPTSILALVKLRRRDLSAILEGSGWAINARMRLTRRQGRYFTMRPPYPKGSRGLYRSWLLAILVLAIGLLVAVLIWQCAWR